MPCVRYALHLVVLALGVALSAAEVEIRILQTADIHGCVFQEEGHQGSWQQLAHFIGEQRRQFDDDHLLLIDCGDTCQGTLLATLSCGEAPLEVLRVLRYDVWVPGNHEMDFGVPRFLELSEQYRDIILCSNFRPLQGEPYRGWRMFERGGARIAVIGATASYMSHWLNGKDDSLCHVTKAEAELRHLLPEIHAAKPDMIILAAHQGWLEGKDARGVNEIAAISEKFPEIDLILGAHTHRYLPGQRLGQRPWYLQSGCKGRALGIATVKIDTAKHQVVDISSSLQYVSKSTPAVTLDSPILRKWQRVCQERLDEVLVERLLADITPEGRPGINCQASELFCLALAKASGAEVVFHGALSTKKLTAGQPVTGKDIFEFVPYENTIFTARLTAEEIGQVIKEQWAQREVYTYCGVWGARARVDAQGEVTVLRVGEDKPEADKRYLVAFNSFTVAGGGRYPLLRKLLDAPAASLQDTGISTRQAVIDYLRANQNAPLPMQRWLW